METDSPPSTEPQPPKDHMLDLLVSSMQATAELLDLIEGPASAQAAKMHAEIAEAARRADHPVIKALMQDWGAWVRSGFGEVPHEIEAHPDRSVRQACQLALHGFREGLRINVEETGLRDRIVAGFEGSAEERLRMLAECREHVLRSATDDLRETAAEGLFGVFSPSLLKAMAEDGVRAANLFSALEGPACGRLAECLREMAAAIEARDPVRHDVCVQRMLDYKIGDFQEVRAELAEHSDSALRDMGLAYLASVNKLFSGDPTQALEAAERTAVIMPVQ